MLNESSSGCVNRSGHSTRENTQHAAQISCNYARLASQIAGEA